MGPLYPFTLYDADGDRRCYMFDASYIVSRRRCHRIYGTREDHVYLTKFDGFKYEFGYNELCYLNGDNVSSMNFMERHEITV